MTTAGGGATPGRQALVRKAVGVGAARDKDPLGLVSDFSVS